MFLNVGSVIACKIVMNISDHKAIVYFQVQIYLS